MKEAGKGEELASKEDSSVLVVASGINDTSRTDVKKDTTKVNKTYASATYGNQLDMCRKLFEVPTEVDENGYEYVIFDEVMIDEGCKKW